MTVFFQTAGKINSWRRSRKFFTNRSVRTM